jgi:hypothetical protein
VKHPGEGELALYAGGELGWWGRFRIARHLAGCERCARQVQEFQSVREFLGDTGEELPLGVHWHALGSEMKANIRVGLAAGRCVGEAAPERVRVPWRTPALALPVLLVVLVGWILQSLPPPHLRPATPASSALVLDASQAGIGAEQNGRGFRLLHPRAENVVFGVRGESVRSRYVDGETGQVTISHVYAE